MSDDGRFSFLTPGRLHDGELDLVLARCTPGDQARGQVPAYGFEMRVGATPVGSINLRIGWTFDLEHYFGHLGYDVVPSFRGHHYAERACRLLLPLARAHGLTAVWITCNPDNVASRRTCELLGATLVDIVALPPTTEMYQRGEREKCRYRLALD
jgi:predicted acetyltransferase